MESWASVQYDGSVSLASAMAHSLTGEQTGSHVDSASLEGCVSDLMALTLEASRAIGSGDYEVRAGLVWTGDNPLSFTTTAESNSSSKWPATTVARYSPVTMSVRTDVDDLAFGDQVVDFAEDMVNQGGVRKLVLLKRSSG